MGILDWFKNKTMEGTIKNNLGEFEAAKGSGKIQIQEMEPEQKTERLFRVNVIRTTMASYQSLPILLNETQIKEINQTLSKTIESK